MVKNLQNSVSESTALMQKRALLYRQITAALALWKTWFSQAAAL